MGIKLTNDEKRQLQRNSARGGWSISKLENVDEQPWSFWHDPTTGREMRLPSDPWSLVQYKSKGYLLGKAPDNFTPVESDEGLPPDIQRIVNAAVKAALEAVGKVSPASNQDIEQEKKPVQLKLL